MRGLRSAPRNLGRRLQILRRTLQLLACALKLLRRALRGLSRALPVLVGALPVLNGALLVDRDGLRHLRVGGNVLRCVLQVLSGVLQFLVRALKVLGRGQRRLGSALQILVCALELLRRAAQVLQRAQRELRRRRDDLRRALQCLGRAAIRKRAAVGIAVVVAVVFQDRDGVGSAFPDGPRREAGIGGQCFVLVSNEGRSVQLNRAAAGRLGLRVPVAVGRHDREVLLAGILHRVTGHAAVDTVLLASVVAANPCQTFARRRGTERRLREELAEPGVALCRIEIADRYVLSWVDRRVRRRILGLHGDETDAEAVGQRREREARRALRQADASAVVGVPGGEIGPLVGGRRAGAGADSHACPIASAGGRLADAGVGIGARRARIVQRLRSGVDVVVRRFGRIGKAGVQQRLSVIGFEIACQVDGRLILRVRGDVVRDEAGIGRRSKVRSREERPVGLLGYLVGLRRVEVENVALRALVAHAVDAGQRLHLVGHVGPAHRARGVHQQHDVGLDLR